MKGIFCLFELLLITGLQGGVAEGEGKPDLIVREIHWLPSHPVIGDVITFEAVVENKGTTQADGNIETSFLVDGTLVAWSHDQIGALAAGASRTFTANGGPNQVSTWTALAGKHAVVAWVDDSDRIAESDEGNNMLTAELNSDTSRPVMAERAGPETVTSQIPSPKNILPNVPAEIGGALVMENGKIEATTPDGRKVSIQFAEDGRLETLQITASNTVKKEEGQTSPAHEPP